MCVQLSSSTMFTSNSGYVDTESEYSFSVEMLEVMLEELNRLITKYSSDIWSRKPTANAMVGLLMEHVFYLQMEMTEVKSGTRKMKAKGFLGPRTRDARRRLRANESSMGRANETSVGGANETSVGGANETAEDRSITYDRQQTKDHHKRLNDVGQHMFMKKRRGIKKQEKEGSPK